MKDINAAICWWCWFADYIFFANFVSQQLYLRNQINVAICKVSGSNINVGILTDDFKQRVRNFVVNDKAYTFRNNVKGSPAYWKNMLSDVLAMVKQLGISFFLTLSFAHSRWDELKGEFSQDEVKMISHFYRCEWLNSNPVLLARYFQFRVESFFLSFKLGVLRSLFFVEKHVFVEFR